MSLKSLKFGILALISGLVILVGCNHLGQGLDRLGLAAETPEPALHVYHVGNSVTDTLNYGAFGQLVQSHGLRYVFGRHVIPGAPLGWIWIHPDSGFSEAPFGYYPQALSQYQWDILTLQPFDRHLDGEDGDVPISRKFIDLALPKSPNLRIYVYSRWPRRDENGSINYEQKWLRRYTGGWDGTEETQDYFKQVTQSLRNAYPQLQDRIFMIPVGDVFLELDRRMRAGQVPGYTSIAQVYSDGIHVNAVGSYIVGCTFYATLLQDNPQGLSASPYEINDPELVNTIQEVVWEVVRSEPLTGVGENQASAIVP
jgi:hypothetical protein